jgi:hypothetical protein
VEGFLFWRNPQIGLIGPRLSYERFRGLDQFIYGAHAEGYYNNITIRAEGGGLTSYGHKRHENFDDEHQRQESFGYGQLDIHWYLMPNLDLNGAGAVTDRQAVGQIGFELQPGFAVLPGLSVLADLGAGNHDLKYASIGVRYYFSENKSLVRRHREDMVLPAMDLFAFNDLHQMHKPQFLS